jgi:Zn-finger nucleic acid-binding protein
MTLSPYRCPSCSEALESQRHDPGASFVCSHCGGVAVTIPVIRKHADTRLVNAIWNAARASQVSSSRPCPGCRAPLREVSVIDANGTTQVDACVSCQFIWFDPSELSALGVSFKDPPPSSEAARAIAVAKAEIIADTARVQATAKTIKLLLDLLLS